VPDRIAGVLFAETLAAPASSIAGVRLATAATVNSEDLPVRNDAVLEARRKYLVPIRLSYAQT
jgi:hypothetical protein